MLKIGNDSGIRPLILKGSSYRQHYILSTTENFSEKVLFNEGFRFRDVNKDRTDIPHFQLAH